MYQSSKIFLFGFPRQEVPLTYQGYRPRCTGIEALFAAPRTKRIIAGFRRVAGAGE
jgi:hypothetical protein